MTEERIFISGFGGQGVVLAGNILAYAALDEGKSILGMVSYGAEMRGGASSSSVIISDEEIDSPIIEEASIGLIMSQEAYIKYNKKVQKGGILFVNSSEVDITNKRDDILIIEVPATELSKEMGNVKVANMIMVGALIAKTKIVKKESVIRALGKPFSGKKRSLIYINESALKKGMDLINNQPLN
jgi:2-oxoglutarate ferredoxin oxidoreductase subunit gamma